MANMYMKICNVDAFASNFYAGPLILYPQALHATALFSPRLLHWCPPLVVCLFFSS